MIYLGKINGGSSTHGFSVLLSEVKLFTCSLDSISLPTQGQRSRNFSLPPAKIIPFFCALLDYSYHAKLWFSPSLKNKKKTKKNPKFNLFPCSPKFTEKYVWSCCSSLRLLTLFGPACHQNCCCKAHRWPPHSLYPCLTFPNSDSWSLCSPWCDFLLGFNTLHCPGYFFFYLPDCLFSVLFFFCWFLLISLSSKCSSALGLRLWVFSFSVFTHFLGNFIELHSFKFYLLMTPWFLSHTWTFSKSCLFITATWIYNKLLKNSGWGTHVYLWRIHFDIWQI